MDDPQDASYICDNVSTAVSRATSSLVSFFESAPTSLASSISEFLPLYSPDDKIFDNISSSDEPSSIVSLPFSDSILQNSNLFSAGDTSSLAERFSSFHREAVAEVREELGLSSSVCSLLAEEAPCEFVARPHVPREPSARYCELLGYGRQIPPLPLYRSAASEGTSSDGDGLLSGLWNTAALSEQFAAAPRGPDVRLGVPGARRLPPLQPWAVREHARDKCLEWFDKHFQPQGRHSQL